MESPEQYKSRIKHLEQDLHNLEAYMEEFTSFLPLAVCIVNKDRVIVDLNEAFTRFVGYESREAAGSQLATIFNEEEKIEGLLDAVANTPGAVQSVKITMVSKSGNERTVRVTAGVRHDVDSNFTGFFIGIANVFDYSESQNSTADKERGEVETTPEGGETEEVKKTDLEEDETEEQGLPPEAPKDAIAKEVAIERGQALIDSVPDGMLLLDDDSVVSAINARAAEILQLDQSAVVEESLDSFSENERLQEMLANLPQTAEQNSELTLSEEVFSISTQQLSIAGSEYRLIMLHDVSRDEFVEDMKLKFVSVAAHQIRTPLSAIRWSFEILVNQLDDGEDQDIARRGYRSTKNMLEIVNELLNLDRLSSGEDGYNFEPVNVVDLINDYVEEVRHNNKIIDQAQVHFQEPYDPLPKVRADQEKIRIVLRNLIDNALKYTDPDGTVKVDTSVHVSQDYGSDMVQFSVKDSGIGIPEDQQDKIFSKFYRANNATKQQTDGTGIGLFICKQIVEMHDGTIWFESVEDEGTTFFVKLPMAQNQE